MGRLYDACQHLMSEIEARGLDPFRSAGQVAIRTGFLISLVPVDEPDDPEKLKALSDAASSLFGITVRT